MRSEVRRSRQNGFTLVELLIVTLLLSMVMMTGMYAYSLFTNKWRNELGHFNETAREVTNFQRLQYVLETIEPYVVKNQTALPVFFFVGGRQSVLAVTDSGLFDPMSPEIFRLSVETDANGKFELLYQARSAADELLISSEQSVEFSHQLTLFKELDDVSFRYYGWSSPLAKNQAGTGDAPGARAQWYEIFSGLDYRMMPEILELTIRRGERHMVWRIRLDENAYRWFAPYTQQE